MISIELLAALSVTFGCFALVATIGILALALSSDGRLW